MSAVRFSGGVVLVLLLLVVALCCAVPRGAHGTGGQLRLSRRTYTERGFTIFSCLFGALRGGGVFSGDKVDTRPDSFCDSVYFGDLFGSYRLWTAVANGKIYIHSESVQTPCADYVLMESDFCSFVNETCTFTTGRYCWKEWIDWLTFTWSTKEDRYHEIIALPGTTCNCGPGVCEPVSRRCICPPGVYGESCQMTCNATTDCSGNGVCGVTGVCRCDSGWIGAACNVPCSPTQCNGRGVCLLTGGCECTFVGYDPALNCSACLLGFFEQSGACWPCDCQGLNATCSDGPSGTGQCTCAPGGMIGHSCNQCPVGTAGANCSACLPCAPGGRCDQGLAGTGTCTCEFPHTGGNCTGCEAPWDGGAGDCTRCALGGAGTVTPADTDAALTAGADALADAADHGRSTRFPLYTDALSPESAYLPVMQCGNGTIDPATTADVAEGVTAATLTWDGCAQQCVRLARTPGRSGNPLLPTQSGRQFRFWIRSTLPVFVAVVSDIPSCMGCPRADGILVLPYWRQVVFRSGTTSILANRPYFVDLLFDNSQGCDTANTTVIFDGVEIIFPQQDGLSVPIPYSYRVPERPHDAPAPTASVPQWLSAPYDAALLTLALELLPAPARGDAVRSARLAETARLAGVHLAAQFNYSGSLPDALIGGVLSPVVNQQIAAPTSTRTAAWAVLALVTTLVEHQRRDGGAFAYGSSEMLAAVGLARIMNTTARVGAGGFAESAADPYRRTATNAAAAAAFFALHHVTRDAQWLDAAEHAAALVAAAWDGLDHFGRGFLANGSRDTTAPSPDDQALPALLADACPDTLGAGGALAGTQPLAALAFAVGGAFAAGPCAACPELAAGVAFESGGEYWPEGTAMLAVASHANATADAAVRELLWLQSATGLGALPGTGCKGIIQGTGTSWSNATFPHAHVASTAWLVLALAGANPFRVAASACGACMNATCDLPCNCSQAGSNGTCVPGALGDKVCAQCFPRFRPPFCDDCQEGFFGTNCTQDCASRFCNEPRGVCVSGTNSSGCACFPPFDGGACTSCLPGYEDPGLNCSTCTSSRYYRTANGSCLPCLCNPAGSSECNSTTGECICVEGFWGPLFTVESRCWNCTNLSYPTGGAGQCDACNCNLDNGVCNVTDGSCLYCFGGWSGPNCASCAFRFSNRTCKCSPYAVMVNTTCLPCDCTWGDDVRVAGCDPATRVCFCNMGYEWDPASKTCFFVGVSAAPSGVRPTMAVLLTLLLLVVFFFPSRVRRPGAIVC